MNIQRLAILTGVLALTAACGGNGSQSIVEKFEQQFDDHTPLNKA